MYVCIYRSYTEQQKIILEQYIVYGRNFPKGYKKSKNNLCVKILKSKSSKFRNSNIIRIAVSNPQARFFFSVTESKKQDSRISKTERTDSEPVSYIAYTSRDRAKKKSLSKKQHILILNIIFILFIEMLC